MRKKLGRWMLTALLLGPAMVMAQDAAPEAAGAVAESLAGTVAEELNGLDTMWVLLAAFLVFFMQLGFMTVEAGFVRVKNVCNIISKNVLDYCLATVLFMVCGYAFMFGDPTNGFVGLNGFLLNGATNPLQGSVPLFAFFMFQVAFAGCAATIVSGSVAERMKFSNYLVYTVCISLFVYPMIGHWTWGGGWLSQLGFHDFAGSAIVHTTGGVIGLVGAMMLGPRIGRFAADGTPKPLPGHSIPMVAIGAFILWFGWFGFNPGSSVSITGNDAINQVGLVTINTNAAAAAGTITAMLFTWIRFGKPDLTMALNGMLAGLVGITAPCAVVTPWAAVLIGAVAGILVALGVIVLDKLRIDDPVGAFPVHGLNGLWGTLAVGLFAVPGAIGDGVAGLFYGGGVKQLGIQALGWVAIAAYAMGTMAVVFFILKKTVGLRVSREEEIKGLDVGEHGLEAYADFQTFPSK